MKRSSAVFPFGNDVEKEVVGEGIDGAVRRKAGVPLDVFSPAREDFLEERKE